MAEMSKHLFEYFSIKQPGEGVSSRAARNPQEGIRRKKIDILQEEKEFEEMNKEVWDDCE